jgi:hypothetical protein
MGPVTKQELDAIRERNEERKRMIVPDMDGATLAGAFVDAHDGCDIDIEALLAEVEHLQIGVDFYKRFIDRMPEGGTVHHLGPDAVEVVPAPPTDAPHVPASLPVVTSPAALCNVKGPHLHQDGGGVFLGCTSLTLPKVRV